MNDIRNQFTIFPGDGVEIMELLPIPEIPE